MPKDGSKVKKLHLVQEQCQLLGYRNQLLSTLTLSHHTQYPSKGSIKIRKKEVKRAVGYMNDGSGNNPSDPNSMMD